MIGSLVYEDYKELYSKKQIISDCFSSDQIQPSSIDLSLSKECYEIKSSFLSPKNKVKKKLENLLIKKIDLSKKQIFKKNKTYIVRLNEKLNLPKNIMGYCNPKSSTGRLDVFCRTILNNSDEYEKVPRNYKGDMFLEITTRSFDIEFISGDRLNQLRLVFKRNNYINDSELKKINNKKLLILNNSKKLKENQIENGIKISVDLKNRNSICAYVAKSKTPVLKFNKVNYHNFKKFWDPVKSKNGSIIIDINKFYILKSKEKITIPPELAGEMTPYDTGIGDFRVHYAGFFDPGFGYPNGSYAVLEVKTNEVPFLLEDGQTIARIKYEKLNKVSTVIYGNNIKSNYQNQGLALSKHFF